MICLDDLKRKQDKHLLDVLVACMVKVCGWMCVCMLRQMVADVSVLETTTPPVVFYEVLCLFLNKKTNKK